jgi:hypothetical protein
MTNRDILTPHDEAWLANQAKQTDLVHNSIELAHLESRMERHLKEAEAIKARLMELHKDEAVNCMEFVCSASEDSKAALR